MISMSDEWPMRWLLEHCSNNTLTRTPRWYGVFAKMRRANDGPNRAQAPHFNVLAAKSAHIKCARITCSGHSTVPLNEQKCERSARVSTQHQSMHLWYNLYVSHALLNWFALITCTITPCDRASNRTNQATEGKRAAWIGTSDNTAGCNEYTVAFRECNEETGMHHQHHWSRYCKKSTREPACVCRMMRDLPA